MTVVKNVLREGVEASKGVAGPPYRSHFPDGHGCSCSQVSSRCCEPAIGTAATVQRPTEAELRGTLVVKSLRLSHCQRCANHQLFHDFLDFKSSLGQSGLENQVGSPHSLSLLKQTTRLPGSLAGIGDPIISFCLHVFSLAT